MCVCVKMENNLEVARLGTVDRVGTPSFYNDSIHRNDSFPTYLSRSKCPSQLDSAQSDSVTSRDSMSKSKRNFEKSIHENRPKNEIKN